MNETTAVDPSILAQLRDASQRIASAAGYRLVVLFGSAARGEAQPSDIDIGVIAQGPIDVSDCEAQFQAAVNIGTIDVADLRRANPVLLMAVAREGVPLYEATGTDFAEFSSLAMRRYADTRKFRDAVRDDIREYAALPGTATGNQL